MNLLAHLVARLVAVVVICLAVAIGWVMVDAHRTIEHETVASADRVGRHLEALYWQKLLWRGGMRKDTPLPSPDWETLPTLTIISPGVCVSFSPPGVQARQICSQVEALGAEPPAWFVYLYTSVLGSHQPITRALSIRDTDAGSVPTSADPGAALRQSWGTVASGTRVLSEDVSRALAADRLAGSSDLVDGLSPREAEILRLLASGVASEEIATLLGLSPKTVRNQHYAIKSKIGARNDAHMVWLAVGAGLLPINDVKIGLAQD